MTPLEIACAKFKATRAQARQPSTWQAKKEKLAVAAEKSKSGLFDPRREQCWYFPLRKPESKKSL